MTELTIEDLAQATGFTVRNIRNHQTRGILPGPRKDGRVGLYGDVHVERLRLIRRLQNDGISLRAIELLLATRGETADRMQALRLDVRSQISRERTPERLTIAEAEARFGPMDAPVVELALALDAVELDEDGALVVQDPALLSVLEGAAAQGLSLGGAIAAAVEVQRLCSQAASVFVDLIRRDVWEPFDQAGHPDDGWQTVSAAIERVRPLADEIFSIMLRPAIDAEVERVFDEETGKLAADAAAASEAADTPAG